MREGERTHFTHAHPSLGNWATSRTHFACVFEPLQIQHYTCKFSYFLTLPQIQCLFATVNTLKAGFQHDLFDGLSQATNPIGKHSHCYFCK